MTRRPDTTYWKAEIAVELTPCNQYGDALNGDSYGNGLRYTQIVTGSLGEIVERLEQLKDQKKPIADRPASIFGYREGTPEGDRLLGVFYQTKGDFQAAVRELIRMREEGTPSSR